MSKKPDSIETYREAVGWVESFTNTSLRNNFGPERKDPSFYIERTKELLGRVGHPERELKYIHVTGTAGKGSVCHMLQENLSASGLKTGLFTSPYSTSATEQIKINELYISPTIYAEVVRQLKPIVEDMAVRGAYGAPSNFEITLTIALLYFKSRKCDWVVLEVGLGGRYDATNVIPDPAVTAITNINLDHTEILGETLPEIAYDKAGIIKSGSHFFTTEDRPELQYMFQNMAREVGAVYHRVETGETHQESNNNLVIAILDYLDQGGHSGQHRVLTTCLPGRFEIMEGHPYVILDGAHNEAKIQSVISNLKTLSYEKLITIISISDTKKDNLAILEPLVEVTDHFIVTGVNKGERKSIHPHTLAPVILGLGSKASIQTVPDVTEALITARELAGKNDCILATGSFFMTGTLREEWYPEEWVLKNRKSLN